MSLLSNFLKRHTWRQVLKLILEDHIQFVTRSIPGYEGVWIRRWVYRLLFKKLGKNSVIYVNAYITHAHNIVAGEYLNINSGSYIDGRGGLIEIGDHVLIGPNVFIGSFNHIVSSSMDNPRVFLGPASKPVKIGSNVWIGANAVICPGVKIGNNSVIGAGCVVTEDIPESVLAAGNPGKVIKNI